METNKLAVKEREKVGEVQGTTTLVLTQIIHKPYRMTC